jgi:hypothetical protein
VLGVDNAEGHGGSGRTVLRRELGRKGFRLRVQDEVDVTLPSRLDRESLSSRSSSPNPSFSAQSGLARHVGVSRTTPTPRRFASAR